jgi:hypothetical protein
MPGLRIEETRGKQIAHRSREITPIARVAHVTWRGGGFDWQRPVAVEVRQGDAVQRVPIHNATRRAVAGIILGELALGVLAVWAEQIYLRRRFAS